MQPSRGAMMMQFYTSYRCRSTVLLLLLSFIIGCDRNDDPGAPPSPRISISVATAQWPRQALVIPELTSVPTLDGNFHPEVWANASIAELTFPTNSSSALKSGARYRVGHRGGVLYLMMEFDWDSDKAPITKAKTLNDNIWNDDDSEVLLARIDDLEHPKEVAFNLAGLSVASRLYHNRLENKLDKVLPLECFRKIQVHKQEHAYVAEIALPLKEILGIKGEVGDVFRLNFYRNHVGGKPAELFWSPIKGERNCRSDFYGMAVLAGPNPAELSQKKAAVSSEDQLVLLDDWPKKAFLTGTSPEWILQNPLAGVVKTDPDAFNWTARLVDSSGQTLLDNKLTVAQWPCRIALDASTLSAGDHHLELRGNGAHTVYYSFPVQFRDWIFVDASDETQCRVEGRSQTFAYPRTIGRNAVQLSKGAKLTVTAAGRAFYLQLPMTFQSPGPFYSYTAPSQLRWNIDAGAWHELNVIDAELETPLEENLRNGSHTVTIECSSPSCMIYGLKTALAPLTCIRGRILSGDYGELLTDVRAQILDGEKIIRDETVRNPLDGKFVLYGVPLGNYTLRLSAAGWKPAEIAISLPDPGAHVQLDTIFLEREMRMRDRREAPGPAYGRSICVAPGESFSTLFSSWTKNPPKSASLVSPYRKIPVEITDFKKIDLGRWNGVGSGTFTVPSNTPFDMYDLQITHEETRRGKTNFWTDVYAQAVCVREPLPESFFIAGCGHTNTWGQQTSEYLAKCSEVAQLAGARFFLGANEVNAAYVSGALANLRIPYATVCGNHTMGRWEDFYPKSYTIDDGPLRIVAHGCFSYDSWSEAEHLFTARPEATNRILLCFEHFAPLDLIRNQKVNLIFDGHSDDPHPERANFPKGTLHVRAPDQQSLRWISMTRKGLAETISKESQIPVLNVPREGLAPLRLEFSSPNNGTAQQQSVTLTNEYEIPFPSARVRLVLARGKYSLTNGKLIQSFDSDDEKMTIIDGEVSVPAKSGIVIRAQ